MRQLIPAFIHERAREGRATGRFTATVLSLDIVGFTSMTQRLMTLGRAGAEIVTSIINRVFDPTAREILAHDGWIGKFVGDQVIAFFEMGDRGLALHAAQSLQGFFEGLSPLETPLGLVRPQARIGLAHGTVSWGIVSCPERDIFYFRGQALSRCMRAQGNCRPGTIAIDASVAHRTTGTDGMGVAPLPPLDPAIASRFIPATILLLDEEGEFRDVACAFIGFRRDGGPLSHAFLTKLVPILLEEVADHGGYLSELDFGDKGSLALVYFGAPTGMERPAAHAANLSLTLRERTDGWARIRVGISHGRVFAGFVGSMLRCEYKAVGGVVNLAARLMSIAPWDGIYLDRNAARGMAQFHTEPVSAVTLKGYADPVPAFALLSRSDTAQGTGVSLPLIGRQREMETLHRHLDPLTRGRCAGILYVDGAAGIGKSRLVEELRTRTVQEGWAWMSMPSDEILRQGLNPLRYFARQYFNCAATQPKEERISNFEAQLAAISHHADSESRAELSRYRSVFGALVDLHWQDSLYERLDARGRRELTFRAFKLLLKLEARQRPVIIELEDCQWIDPDTAEFIRVLMRNIDTCPLAVVAVARLGDDGEPSRIPVHEVRLNAVRLDRLGDEAVRELASRILGGDPSDQLCQMLTERSEGNPFHVEQLIRFMVETEAVCLKHGRYVMAEGAIELPDTISAVLVARIDRLAQGLRDAVKHASVLGREFNTQVLRAMLNRERAEELLLAGSREAIWEPLSELVYIFGHALIREVAYQMQLQETLRRLHRLAAETIEDIFRDDLAEHVGALAHHFDNAGDANRAEPYLWRAAEAAEERWGNEEALEYYRCLAGYPRDPAGEVDLGKRRVTLLERIGRLEEAEKLAQESVEKSRRLDDDGRLIMSLNTLGNVMIRRGKLDDAYACYQEALRIARVRGDLKGISASANNIGRIHRLHGRFHEAMGFFRQDLRIGLRLGDRRGVTATLGNMGGVYGSLGDLRRARRCFEKALASAEEFDDRFGIAISVGSLGLVSLLQGEYDKALAYFTRQKDVAEETGDAYNTAYAAGNIGEVLEKTGELQSAAHLYQKKLEISQEMGYQQGMSIAFSSLGRVYEGLGDYGTAIDFHERAIAIGRQLGLRDYLCAYLNRRVRAELVADPDLSVERLAALDEMAREAHDMAEDAGKTEERAVAAVLRARIAARQGEVDAAVASLHAILPAPRAEDRARVFHALFDITTDEMYRVQALAAYDEIMAARPDASVRRQADMLRRTGDTLPSPEAASPGIEPA